MRGVLPSLIVCWVVAWVDPTGIVAEEDPQQDARVTVHGVTVIGRHPRMAELIPWIGPGTQVGVLVATDTANVLGILEDKSTLQVFQDDRGTDLLRGEDAEGQDGAARICWSRVSDDTMAAAVQIESSVLPAPGARRLHLVGEIVVELGVKRGTERVEAVVLAQGTTFEVAKRTYTISEVVHNQPDAEGAHPRSAEMYIVLEGPRDLLETAEIRFLDGAGNTVPSFTEYWQHLVTPGGAVFDLTTFGLQKATKTATIEVTYWKDTKQVTVPFDLTVTLGPDPVSF